MTQPRRTRLEGGATVVSEAVPGARSVSLGVYFPTGSRFETRETNGISHFIEHLVFKGTPSRSPDAVNREIDLLGGASNAFTGKETTCFHARVLGEHLPRAAELLGDLASNALPPGVEAEVEREREVILSEIRGLEDAPEELVGDLCDQAYFGDHPLGLPVVGDPRAVARLGLAEIRAHLRRHFVAGDLLVAAAGQVDHEELLGLVRRHFQALPPGHAPGRGSPPQPGPVARVLERDLEQVHLSLSAPGLRGSDPRWATAELLSIVVGDGNSSRLFREVRDRRGLAYSVGSQLASYTDAGSLHIDVSVAPERLDETLDVIGGELARVRDGGVEADEVESARRHLFGRTLLGHEYPEARMGYLAEQVLHGLDTLEIEVDLRAIEKARLEEVRALAAELLAGPLALAAVGPVAPGRFGPGGWELPA